VIRIDHGLRASGLAAAAEKVFTVSAGKIRAAFDTWDFAAGAPVITVKGAWRNRGWTEWTLGFHFGSALLQFEATGERHFLESALEGIRNRMPPHLTNAGIHDHGFQIVSTYGNLLRLIAAGRIEDSTGLRGECVQALRISGAVQAARWTPLGGTGGYIHSFNGPHSLFIDTMRTLRSLALAHRLGQHLIGESDSRIALLHRLLRHAVSTSRWNVYYGEGRDVYDESGRVAHEAVFNVRDGSFRCPSTQQGYSPFSTWTRGLAWAVCGFAEQLEFLFSADESEFPVDMDKNRVLRLLETAARAVADFYIRNTPADGVPYWDTGAPGLRLLGDYLEKPAAPFNGLEPVDSSAAAIAAQGLLRLASHLDMCGARDDAAVYRQAGLTIARTIFNEPYLSTDPSHQGLLLHSVYHRPNGWDHIPAGSDAPYGESSQWGDYHFRELALILLATVKGASMPCFFDIHRP